MVHLLLGIFWIIMAVPTLIFWKDSILLVLIMSLYANIESSFSAWEASRNPKEKRQRSRWRYSADRNMYSLVRVDRKRSAKPYTPVRFR